MVAKSYQDWKQLTDPFVENKRLYVMVEKPKGGEKKVRWYTKAEYDRMYPKSKDNNEHKFGPQKEVLGYHDGYIWIFNNFDQEDAEMKAAPETRYGVYCGWYIPSNINIPDIYADRVRKLEWSRVGNLEGYLVSERVAEMRKELAK